MKLTFSPNYIRNESSYFSSVAWLRVVCLLRIVISNQIARFLPLFEYDWVFLGDKIFLIPFYASRIYY